jgi:hypothetical protein
MWPFKSDKDVRYPERRVRGVRECIDVIELARSGEMVFGRSIDLWLLQRPADDPHGRTGR